MSRLRLVLAAALAALGVVAPVAHAETIASPGAATAVKEFAGNVVFSQFDRTTNQWFLTVRRAGAAAPERLPGAPSGRPLRADLGPHPPRRPRLIYNPGSQPP